jgi:perosamine synthetase
MKIPVNEPIVSDLAKKYVNDALDTSWISSAGKYIDKFESKFAKYLGVNYATTVSNGTAALHIALDVLGVSKGDEVIIPDLTIISCAAAVRYLDAIPVFVDVKESTGNIDPQKIEAAITKKTKVIMVVDLYGHPADYKEINKIAKKYNLSILEDAAEAHGAEYYGQKAGSLADIATFSFYANKIITTGEGGMVVTDKKDLIEKIKLKKNLSHKPGQRFFHEEIGYNYRMTNLQAALGLANLEDIDKYLNKKYKIAKFYNDRLKKYSFLKLPKQNEHVKSVYWMYTIELLKNSPISRDDFMSKLKEKGVDTRTYFYPLHTMPALSDFVNNNSNDFPIANKLSKNGFYIPSGLALTIEQMEYVTKSIDEIINEK